MHKKVKIHEGPVNKTIIFQIRRHKVELWYFVPFLRPDMSYVLVDAF